MKDHETPECCQNFAMDHVLGGPRIVVNDGDAFGIENNSIKLSYNNVNHTKELQNELHIANEKLAELHMILEENEALKLRNKELESQLVEKEEKMLRETFSHLSFSLNASPYEHILQLKEELKTVKTELALAINREEWFKQHISRRKLDEIDFKGNALRHGDMFSANETNQENSFAFSRDDSNFERESANNTFLSNTFHSGLKSKDLSKTKKIFAGLANTFTRHTDLAPTVALSLPSRARFEREESPPVRASWDYAANPFSVRRRNSLW